MLKSMAVTLAIQSEDGQLESEACVTFDQPRIVIGRGRSCDFRIPNPSVSFRHASIRQCGSEYVVVDEGSTNGTFLGSLWLHPMTPMALRHGSMVRLGRVWLEVRIEAAIPTAQPVQVTKDLALAMVARILEGDGLEGRPRLVVVEGPDVGREIALDESGRAIIIGRGREVDFAINLQDASRRHARVVRRADQVLQRDLSSRNGTICEGKRVPVDNDVALHPGERFAIGPDVFVFENPAVELLSQIESAEDEAMRADEVVPEPRKSVVVPEPDRSEALGWSDSADSVHSPAKPPSQPLLPRNVRHSKQKKRTGWGKADFVIVLLALAVLVCSALGLMWLFRGV